jgi:hypothetical protein
MKSPPCATMRHEEQLNIRVPNVFERKVGRHGVHPWHDSARSVASNRVLPGGSVCYRRFMYFFHAKEAGKEGEVRRTPNYEIQDQTSKMITIQGK